MYKDRVGVDLKKLSVIVPKDIWLFLKRTSTDKEQSMNEIIGDMLERYKKRLEKNTGKDEVEVKKDS